MLKISRNVMLTLYARAPLRLRYGQLSNIQSRESDFIIQSNKHYMSTNPKPNVLNPSWKKKNRHKKKSKFKPYEELLEVLNVHKDNLKDGKCKVCPNKEHTSVTKITLDSNSTEPKYRTTYFPPLTKSCCNTSDIDKTSAISSSHSSQGNWTTNSHSALLNPAQCAVKNKVSAQSQRTFNSLKGKVASDEELSRLSSSHDVTTLEYLENMPNFENLHDKLELRYNQSSLDADYFDNSVFSDIDDSTTLSNAVDPDKNSKKRENKYVAKKLEKEKKSEKKLEKEKKSFLKKLEKEKIALSKKLEKEKIFVQKKLENKKEISKNKELEKIIRNRFFSNSLKTYIKVCVSGNMVVRAHVALLYYRYKSKMSTKLTSLNDVEIFDALLCGWARKGDISRVKEVFSDMAADGVTPSVQSYAAYLECLCRSKNYSPSEVEKIALGLKEIGKSFKDIFIECKFTGDQSERISEMIHVIEPSTSITFNDNLEPYSCKLLEKLNDKDYEKGVTLPCINNCINEEDISRLAANQMQMENDYFFKVKSVATSPYVSERVQHLRQSVQDSEELFKKELSDALKKNLRNLWGKVKSQKSISLYPYLKTVDSEFLVTLLLQEIRFLAETSEFFSPNLKMLYKGLGEKVMNNHFICLKKSDKITDKVSFIYQKYMEYVLTPELATKYLPREYWEILKTQNFNGPTIDIADKSWPQHVLYEVGKFLYDILLHHSMFNVNSLHQGSSKKRMTPAFYTTYVSSGVKLSEQIRAHPSICKLYREAELEQLEFDVHLVPMVTPPRPWTRFDAGGLLLTATPFVRLPSHAHHQNAIYSKVPNEELHPCFDSLNSLSLCPWIINKPLLDLIIEIFRNNGSEELDIPLNPATISVLPKITATMTKEEKSAIFKQKALLKKNKLEMTSLWYDCLYKLSIANHFRDKIFWFPHNLDFRGRVYPTPPHFNHLGNDVIRSILLFAEGRPLGKNGFDWLKIHLINLTGFKKRDSTNERLRYADEMMLEILDSADKPFTGNQWWRTSDKPWQTLACCKEVANAVRSSNPFEYVSHLPIHQDGSCNGLQHYAALGCDALGAKEVNLLPNDLPQDVYSGVAALVEKERRKDAADGSQIAESLDGFVKRKVVKQTVMTYVYGVTRYGAKLQILKQLKDISDFPQEHCNSAATYLMTKTFLSIEQMFTATKEIQKWFTDSAQLITKVSGEPVQWITPLGLPVLQPYHQKTTIRSPSDFIAQRQTNTSYTSTFENYQLPNALKQKNAFAPNFIHSLDSSHMMLTSLFCHRRGITFVSVHDCFWTHASTVEIMNKVCRQQFVSLHKEPILENLSVYFLHKYGRFDDNCHQKHKKNKQTPNLKDVLRNVPEKGSFDVTHVLESVYFFS